ncbi:hypothetical protein [Streptomyces albireticuli]|uniref:hypothetical protein n=1 Tax=Streptomyces albireticuli TaxID=1940 RepID=UPI001472C07F|nr:hypothetical protein [Streptomyces albireticuli]MCD9144939.1 hypothetical protein [Streptomyces albireticuli]MCD9164365.1 hypothetical protein [Streptomyces albireticuli]MCD9194076.1 hypothetical protein [Streptomyces albireticuli]
MSDPRSTSGLAVGVSAFTAVLTATAMVLSWKDGSSPWTAAAAVSLLVLAVLMGRHRRR